MKDSTRMKSCIQQSNNKKGVKNLVKNLFLRTVKRNIENQTYKHKFTNTYFRFKTQDARVNWMLIQNEMYPHVFRINTLEKQNRTEDVPSLLNQLCQIP